ncbi:hypothetical protein V2A60_005221 [Cordyceps javanica]
MAFQTGSRPHRYSPIEVQNTSMADESNTHEQAPDSAVQTAVNGADAATELSSLDTPQKDVVMADAAIDQAVNRTSHLTFPLPLQMLLRVQRRLEWARLPRLLVLLQCIQIQDSLYLPKPLPMETLLDVT